MRRVLILNGPNLDKLGRREPEVYGADTLEDIEARVIALAAELDVAVAFRQSDGEGELVGALTDALGEYDGVVFNPGAYTHYSYALHDAVRTSELPVVEVHLSNIAAREEFRARSVIAPACVGWISGMGAGSYTLGLRAVVEILDAEASR